MKRRRFLAMGLGAVSGAGLLFDRRACGADDATPVARVVDTKVWRIWGDGRHNGFPGIARFGDHYYVTFRRANQHREEEDSTIVVIRSPAGDLKTWQQVAEFRREHDSRDPLLVVVGRRLQVVWHSKEDWYSQSDDGLTWTATQPLDTEFPNPPPGSTVRFSSQRRWLFRIRRGPDGAYYSLGRCGINEKGSGGPFGLILYRSEDGVRYRAMHTFGEGPSAVLSKAGVSGWGHEADVAWWPDGTMVTAIRAKPGAIAWSRPPYRQWTAYSTGVFNFGGPALHTTPQGAVLLAARSEPESRVGPSKQMVWSVGREGLAGAVELPSGGDCAYSSFVDGPSGEVLLCYYSGHERIEKAGSSDRPTNIYLAQIGIGGKEK